jgi:hypothetical protein
LEGIIPEKLEQETKIHCRAEVWSLMLLEKERKKEPPRTRAYREIGLAGFQYNKSMICLTSVISVPSAAKRSLVPACPA